MDIVLSDVNFCQYTIISPFIFLNTEIYRKMERILAAYLVTIEQNLAFF